MYIGQKLIMSNCYRNNSDNSDNSEEKQSQNELVVEDIGSELSEESYDYDDKDDK